MTVESSEFKRASTLLKPHKQPGTLKLRGYKPQSPPTPEQARFIREKLVVPAVYGIYYVKQKPATLIGIFTRVQDRINAMRTTGQWPYKSWQPSKRYVDRRVNEAADPRFYCDGAVPKIVCVTAGRYQPNPELMEQHA